MKEQEMTQQEPEVVETPVEEAAQEAEVIDVAALTAAAAKAEEYLAMAQRTQADFDNFRRRNESVRADAFAEGQRAVAKAILAVLDNLERALAAPAVEGAVKYEIYRSYTGEAGTFYSIDTVTGTSYTHSGAKSGTTYYYKVKAICGSNSKANSALSATLIKLTPSEMRTTHMKMRVA